MSKREKTIAVITVIVFMVFIATKFNKQGKKHLPASPVAVTGTAPAAVSQNANNDFKLDRIVQHILLQSENVDAEYVADPFMKPDPTRRIHDTAPGISELNLAGIMFEEETPVVLINDEILGVGDYALDFEISEIHKNEVIVIRGDEEYTLKLYEDDE